MFPFWMAVMVISSLALGSQKNPNLPIQSAGQTLAANQADVAGQIQISDVPPNQTANSANLTSAAQNQTVSKSVPSAKAPATPAVSQKIHIIKGEDNEGAENEREE